MGWRWGGGASRGGPGGSLTIPLTPSGKRKRLYSVLTVSSGRISHSFWSRRSPVSRPSSAQKMVKPPFLSPWMRVLGSRGVEPESGRKEEKEALGAAPVTDPHLPRGGLKTEDGVY